MNARKHHNPRVSGAVLFAIVVGASISAAGGVLPAYYKNRQVQISRKIDATERRIEQRRLEIRTAEMRMDQLLNRFVIRQQLEANGSRMEPIPVRVIEEVQPINSMRRDVAIATP